MSLVSIYSGSFDWEDQGLFRFFFNFFFYSRPTNVADFLAVFVLKMLNFEQSSYEMTIEI